MRISVFREHGDAVRPPSLHEFVVCDFSGLDNGRRDRRLETDAIGVPQSMLLTALSESRESPGQLVAPMLKSAASTRTYACAATHPRIARAPASPSRADAPQES